MDGFVTRDETHCVYECPEDQEPDSEMTCACKFTDLDRASCVEGCDGNKTTSGKNCVCEAPYIVREDLLDCVKKSDCPRFVSADVQKICLSQEKCTDEYKKVA